MSSVGGASRGSSSSSTGGSRSAGTAHGKSAATRTSKSHQATKSHQSKKTGHTTKDSFEGKPVHPKISAVVSALNPKANFLAKGKQTFCNQFAAAYARMMGDTSLQGKTANQIISGPLSQDYHKVSADDAMKAAAEGKVAFAAWSNPHGDGHIAAVVGETEGKPAIAQAGTTNYNFAKVSLGFGPSHPPSYYVHN